MQITMFQRLRPDAGFLPLTGRTVQYSGFRRLNRKMPIFLLALIGSVSYLPMHEQTSIDAKGVIISLCCRVNTAAFFFSPPNYLTCPRYSGSVLQLILRTDRKSFGVQLLN